VSSVSFLAPLEPGNSSHSRSLSTFRGHESRQSRQGGSNCPKYESAGDYAAVLTGGESADILTGSPEGDTIEGRGGADFLRGGPGNDVIIGGMGDDVLWGEDGDDDLQGNMGSDRLVGGPGNDLLRGGTGADTYVYARGDGDDVIEDFPDEENIILLERFSPWEVVITMTETEILIKLGGGSITLRLINGLSPIRSMFCTPASPHIIMIRVDGLTPADHASLASRSGLILPSGEAGEYFERFYVSSSTPEISREAMFTGIPGKTPFPSLFSFSWRPIVEERLLKTSPFSLGRLSTRGDNSERKAFSVEFGCLSSPRAFGEGRVHDQDVWTLATGCRSSNNTRIPR